MSLNLFWGTVKNLTLSWDADQKIETKNISYYFNLALKNRKELKQKQQEIEQQEEYRKFYKKTYLPSLGINANVGRTENLSAGSGEASSYFGINLAWNILDGGANYHESQKANAERLRALMEKNHYTQQVKYEVEHAYNELASYMKQLAAQDIQLAQAQNEFNLKKLQRRIGELSLVAFETAKKQLGSPKTYVARGQSKYGNQKTSAHFCLRISRTMLAYNLFVDKRYYIHTMSI